MDRGFGYVGGGLATRRRSSSGHHRICVSGGCRVGSDGAAWTRASGPKCHTSNRTIASESETIESFCTESRIREVELPRLDGGFELWSTTPLLHSVPATQNPKRGDEERGWLPGGEILVSEGRNSRSPCRNWS